MKKPSGPITYSVESGANVFPGMLWSMAAAMIFVAVIAGIHFGLR